MAEQPKDVTLEILIKIQEGVVDLRDRSDRVENIVRKNRRDSAGMLVMMRSAAGFFDERVNDIEARVAAIEAAES